jgi:MGT family glycosyltransferase
MSSTIGCVPSWPDRRRPLLTMATIAMPHIGLGGHLLPAARVGAILAEEGHQVIAWAPERFRSHVEVPGVSFRPHEPADTRRPFPTFVHFAAALADATERCSPALIDEMLDAHVDIVVHDVHVPWARVAGDFLGLPRIVTNPLFPSLSADGSGAAHRSRRPREEDGRRREPLAQVERCRRAIRQQWGIDVGPGEQINRSGADTILCFTTEEILGQVPEPPYRCVGPLIEPFAPPTRPSRPLAYVAFGTFFNTWAEPFRIVIEALADEPIDVLVSTGGGTLTAADLGPLPENVNVTDFVRPGEVLSRAAVHVSHGGGGSLHEALAAGVPTVCIPLGSDQHAWSQRVEALGAGCVVKLSADAIRAGVSRLIADERCRRRTQALAQHLDGYPGRTRVLDAVAEQLSAG